MICVVEFIDRQNRIRTVPVSVITQSQRPTHSAIIHALIRDGHAVQQVLMISSELEGVQEGGNP